MFFPKWRRSALLPAGLLGLALFVLAMARFLPVLFTRHDNRPRASSIDQQLETFVNSYWQRPIPPQGPPPASFTEREASLSATACGSCHLQQHTDWSASLHARAMGAGPWGQIVDLARDSPRQAAQCLACHAPLSEQNPHLIAGDIDTIEKNRAFDPALQLQGITCATCHVRRHERFGPPKVEGANVPRYPAALPNHAGAHRTAHFEQAAFCRGCHQFDPEDEALSINGKPMQDTFREWQGSAWGKSGMTCQGCHMPGRRHLWRGVHDAEMVQGGVAVEAEVSRRPVPAGAPLELVVEVRNAAVGHKFPTYITPKIFVRAALLDRDGRNLDATLQERIIGWDVRHENGAWKEYFDSRIPPGESRRYAFRWKRPSGAEKIRAWIEVHPDHFYHVHFYPAYLRNADLGPDGRRLIETALRESGRTPYILFERIFPIAGDS